MLDNIKGLNNDLNNNSSIEFDLDIYVSGFINIIIPDYKDENQTIPDKIEQLKGIDKLIEYDKEKMKNFLEQYYNSLKDAIEKTTTLKPTEPVKTDVVGIVNNKQPNPTPDDTDLSLQNKKLDKFDGTFGQQQEASGCGRHALNNLLGHAYFTGYKTGTDDTPYTLVELKDIISEESNKQLNLHKLCKYLNIRESNITDMSEKTPCPIDENYNITVLMIALGLIGFEINNIFQLNEDNANNAPNIDDTNVFGLLINIGGAHWVSARKYKETIYYMNSLEKDNVTTEIGKAALNVIIKGAENTIYTIINTSNPKIAFINLKIDDFIRTAVPVGEKEIYYNQKYIDYIKELKNKDIINNLYSKEFQYSQKLTYLIENDINYKNREEILELLVESKTKNDPQKTNTIKSKINKLKQSFTIKPKINKLKQSFTIKNKSQKKEVKDLN